MSAQPGAPVPIIRSMTPADLTAVEAIERYAYDFPWSRNIFSDCIRSGYLCVVLDNGQGPVAYAVLSTAAAEAHILNLCVNPDYQRQGLGMQLLDYLLDYVREISVARLFLEVRPSNAAAIALYEGAEFSRLGVRKSYYRAADGREDALVFVRDFN